MKYDVCLSFAGEDRAYVERVAAFLEEAGASVFYDKHLAVQLWGKDLFQHLDDVYRNQARYCVLFISAAYATKEWTKHELASAQARALIERREYILPARFDDTELPGLKPTTGFIDLRDKDPAVVADLILQKVKRHPVSRTRNAALRSRVQRNTARTVFLVYSGSVGESAKFAVEIQEAIASDFELKEDWSCSSAHVTQRNWLPNVLHQIRRSDIVICHIAGVRANVLVEFGMAYASPSPVVAVGDPNQHPVPEWLRAFQFYTSNEFGPILAAIRASVRGRNSTPSPLPYRVAWIGDAPWAADARRATQSICERAGLTVEWYTNSSPDDGIEIGRAGLLVAEASGASTPALACFGAGQIYAAPFIGAVRRLSRRTIFASPEGRPDLAFPRAKEFQTVSPIEIAGHVQAYADAYCAWVQK